MFCRGRLKRRGPTDTAYTEDKLKELHNRRPYPFLYGLLSSVHTSQSHSHPYQHLINASNHQISLPSPNVVVTNIPRDSTMNRIPDVHHNYTGDHTVSPPFGSMPNQSMEHQHDLTRKMKRSNHKGLYDNGDCTTDTSPPAKRRNVSPPYNRMGSAMYTEHPPERYYQNPPKYEEFSSPESCETGSHSNQNYMLHADNMPPKISLPGNCNSAETSPCYREEPLKYFQSCSHQNKAGFTPEPLRMSSDANVSPESTSYPGLNISVIPDMTFIDIPDITLSLTSYQANHQDQMSSAY